MSEPTMCDDGECYEARAALGRELRAELAAVEAERDRLELLHAKRLEERDAEREKRERAEADAKRAWGKFDEAMTTLLVVRGTAHELAAQRDRLLAIEREARALVQRHRVMSCGCHRLFVGLETALRSDAGASLLAERERDAEARGSTACPVCGKGEPHGHTEAQIQEWASCQVARFGYSCLMLSGVSDEKADVAKLVKRLRDNAHQPRYEGRSVDAIAASDAIVRLLAERERDRGLMAEAAEAIRDRCVCDECGNHGAVCSGCALAKRLEEASRG